jgi:hypothetical protein
MAIIRNTAASVQLHFTATAANVVIVGNSAASNIALTGETLTGATISKVNWGIANNATAYWLVQRNSNTVLVLSGTNELATLSQGMPLTQDAAANLVITLVGASAVGHIMIELKKIPGITN